MEGFLLPNRNLQFRSLFLDYSSHNPLATEMSSHVAWGVWALKIMKLNVQGSSLFQHLLQILHSLIVLDNYVKKQHTPVLMALCGHAYAETFVRFNCDPPAREHCFEGAFCGILKPVLIP